MDDEVRGGPIPDAMREAVYLRDQLCCRMCGVWLEGAFGGGIHHIIFGYSGGEGPGLGGQRVHVVDEMVLLCEAHHRRAHSEKAKWQPILLATIQRTGVTAFQLERWSRKHEAIRQARQSSLDAG